MLLSEGFVRGVTNVLSDRVRCLPNVKRGETRLLGGRLNVQAFHSVLCAFPCQCVSHSGMCLVDRLRPSVTCVRLHKGVMDDALMKRNHNGELMLALGSSDNVVRLIFFGNVG